MSESCRSCGQALRGKQSGFCPRCLFGTAIAELVDEGEEATPSWEEMGSYLPNFSFEGELGRGGSGVVYLAREKRGGELVAVKVLSPSLAKNPEFAERFRREAKVMSDLSHPHVVEVKNYGEQNGLLFLVMEFLPGKDVSELVKREGKLTLERARELLGMVCGGLAYSHGKGILHRDIKPGNILLDSEGGLKVADFGLAKILNQDSEVGLTMTNAKMGTPRYMAPEQMKEGGEVDERTDVYSLGVVFYELLTGKAPGGSFALPSELVGVSERVDEVVLKAMSDEPDERFASIGEFQDALDSLTRDWKKVRLGVLLVILCAVGILVAVFLPNDSQVGENIELAGFDWVLLAEENQALPMNFPVSIEDAHEVAVSDSEREFGVALMADGSLRGFGSDHYGQSRPPKGNHFVKIAVGRGERAAHALALQKDGRVLAWGDNSFGQTAVPSDLGKAEEVMAGEFWSAAKVGGIWSLWGASAGVDPQEEESKSREGGRTVKVKRK